MMKKILVLLIATSLSANAWMWWRGTPTEEATRLARATAAPVAPEKTGAGSVADGGLRVLVKLDTAEAGVLCAALREAGADESTVRAVVESGLRRRWREQTTAWRTERWRAAWWRGAARSTGWAGAPSAVTLVDEPLRALLGVDPLDVADRELRYDFIAPEKRRKLALMDLDYAELQARSPQGRSNAATKGEQDEQQLLERERRKDLMATLTEAEQAEYDLRFSRTAVINKTRFAAMGLTEQEFRLIEPQLEWFERQRATLPKDASYRAASEVQEQAAIDRIVAAVGYDRALDFLWAGVPYEGTVGVLRNAGLPAGNAARIMQLAAESGAQAAAIHFDESRTVEQKRVALLALQQTVKPALDALAPPVAQAQLPEYVIGWFAVLAEGRYIPHKPMVSGSGYMAATAVSVAQAPKGASVTPALAKAPGK